MSNVFLNFITLNKTRLFCRQVLCKKTETAPTSHFCGSISVFFFIKINIYTVFVASATVKTLLQRSAFVQLVHFFRRQTQLCHGNAFLFGEAEIVHFVIADADADRDLIPLIVCVQAVA